MKTWNRFGRYKMVGREDGVDIYSLFDYIKRKVKLFFNSKKCPDCGCVKDTGTGILICNSCFNHIYLNAK